MHSSRVPLSYCTHEQPGLCMYSSSTFQECLVQVSSLRSSNISSFNLSYRIYSKYSEIFESQIQKNVPSDMCASLAIQNARSEDSDQTARMRRLIWIIAVRKWPNVRFVTLQLKQTNHLGPVVQSIVSLTGLLMTKSFIVVVKVFYNRLTFFAAKDINVFAFFQDGNFNVSLVNNFVRFWTTGLRVFVYILWKGIPYTW